MPQHPFFIDYFVHEFMEELWFLQKFARGLIPARPDSEPLDVFFNLTKALLSLAPIAGLPLGFLLSKELIAKCAECEEEASKLRERAQAFLESQEVDSSLLQQEGPMDLVAIRVLVELIGRGLAERYEQVLSDYLAEPAQQSQIPLARAMAKRLFTYLQETPLEGLSEDVLGQILNGVILGDTDKNWREKLSHTAGRFMPQAIKEMHRVPLLLKPLFQAQFGKLDHFTAEGLLKHSAYYDESQAYEHKETAWLEGKQGLRQAKYGYAYLSNSQAFPRTLVEVQGSQPTEAPPRERRYRRQVALKDIQDYLNSPLVQTARVQKSTSRLSFHDFLHSQGHPKALEAVCHGDLTRIQDWSFANFSGVDFSGARLGGNLSGADFSNAYLVSLRAERVYCSPDHPLSLKGAKLGFGIWCEAKLPKADFRQADLSLTNFSQADLTDIRETGANWYKTDLTGVSRQDLLSAQKTQVDHAQSAFEKRMRDLDQDIAVLRTNVDDLRARLEQLITPLSNPSTLDGPGDVGRKLLMEQTAVQLSHHVQDLEFYLPPTVIKALPKDLSLNDLMKQLNTPQDSKTEEKSTLPERFEVLQVIDNFLQEDEALLLLLGEPGAGKTLSTWQTVKQLIQQFKPEMNGDAISQCWLPLHIELNQFSVQDLNGLIDKQLQTNYQLTEAALGKLKQKSGQSSEPRILLILDGYDELHQDNSNKREHTDLFHRIGGDTWKKGQIKVLVSCRRRYIQDEGEERVIFGVGHYQRYQRFELLPFTLEQIRQYIQVRSSTEVGGGLLRPERYLETLEASQSLQKLLSSPFVLHLFLESLPRLVQMGQNTQEIRTYDLYHAFFNQWIEREVRRLSPANKALLGRDTDGALVNDFKRLAHYLALSMYAEGTINLAFNKDLPDYSVWLKVLNQIAKEAHAEYLGLVSKQTESEDEIFGLAPRAIPDKASLLRQAQARANLIKDVLPLSRTGESLHFVHKSFYEYLLTDSILRLSQDKAFETAALGFFKQRLIQTESAVLSFLRELAPQPKLPAHLHFEGLCKSLFALIQRSAQEPDLGQASSNAASILNTCEVQLTYQTWAGVQLPGADLSYGLLAYSDLRGANLQGANLTHCMLYQANFENADLRDIQWGEFPRLQMKKPVMAIAHHPTKPWLAITQGNEIVLKDRDTDTIIGHPMQEHTHAVTSIAFSPDGRCLASGSEDNRVHLWDTQTQEPIGEALHRHTNDVLTLAFSPDGRCLASGSRDKTVCLWDIQTQEAIGEALQGHTHHVNSVAFSSNGRYLASGDSDNTVRLWDTQTQKAIGEVLQGHTNAVTSLAFSPDGRCLASGSRDSTVRLWDTQTQKVIGEVLQGHTSWVESLAFSPDGRCLASASADKTVRLWDTQAQRPIGEALQGHAGGVNGIAFSPDGRCLASGSFDETVRLWDTQTQTAIGDALQGHTEEVTRLAFSPDGRCLASAGRDQTVRFWDTQTQKAIGEPLQGHTNVSIAISPDLASGTVRLWDTQAQNDLSEPLQGHTNVSIAISPDGRCLASASKDRTVRLWDTQTQRALGEPLQGHTGWVINLAFSPDGRYLASGSYDNRVRLWDTHTQKALGEALQGHTDWVISLAFSPDGRCLASGSYDKTVRLWDTQTQKAIGEALRAHTGYARGIGAVRSLAFSPDGRCLASGGTDNTVYFWDTQTQKTIGERLNEGVAVRSLAFSPDGRHVISAGSRDGTIRLWNIAEQRTRGKSEGTILLRWHRETRTITFSPLPLKAAKTILAEQKSYQPTTLETEDLLALGDEVGAVSFWALSRGANPQIRFLGMPKHSSIPLFPVGTQFTGCQMNAQTRRLLEQYGTDVSQVNVLEHTSTSPAESKQVVSIHTGASTTGLFAKKNPSERRKSPAKPGLAARLPVNPKAQLVLKEILTLLDEVYPSEAEESFQERSAMLNKLKPYQEREASLTNSDHRALLDLQHELQLVQVEIDALRLE